MAVGGVEGQLGVPLAVSRAARGRGDERRGREPEVEDDDRRLEVRRSARLGRRRLAERVGRAGLPAADADALPAAPVREELHQLLSAVEDLATVDERVEKRAAAPFHL